METKWPKIEIVFEIPRLRKRRCGCWRHQMGDLQHWFRYTRLRYWGRVMRGWVLWLRIRVKTAFWRRFIGCLVWHTPVFLCLGMMEIDEACEKEKEFDDTLDRLAKHEKEQLFLGADSDNPNGIYAENGADLICMTNDEWEHWFGETGDKT